MATNKYMQQVQLQAQNVQQELQRKRAYCPEEEEECQQMDFDGDLALPNAPVSRSYRVAPPAKGLLASWLSPPNPFDNLGVRITGWFYWQTVVVPPNMYVVHTKRGEEQPRHIGLGMSFKFNPYTDSFLVVPSAMQTILIQANSICKELQGILIQAYVQWIIDDINTAYKRLDFSDPEEPMRIVNVQLREQAEAAIKDKVATMSINEVLSDKQPIIKELTKRLKEVAEGSGDDKGLGIRIVTVQIKEAVVSSTTLWENLQKPFRSEQAKCARLAEIEQQAIVNDKELAFRKSRETAEMETESELSKLRTEKEAEAFDRDQKEELRRHALEQDAEQKRIAAASETERVRQQEAEVLKEQNLDLEHKYRQFEREKEFEELKHRVELDTEQYVLTEADLKAKLVLDMAEKESEYELKRKEQTEADNVREQALTAKLTLEKKANEVRNTQRECELEFSEREQSIANILSHELVQMKAMEMLPQVAKALPKPDKLETIAIGQENGATLAGTVGTILTLLKKYGVTLKENPETVGVSQEVPLGDSD